MRLLVVGCGSIGRRHAANAASRAETVLVDANPDVADDVAACIGATSFGARLDEALDQRPAGVVVAVPHKHHLEVAERAVRSGADVLVEKPIALDCDAAERFLDEVDALRRRVWVVCNMRYHPAIRALRAHLPRIGRPLFARAHYGNYLPDMRPGTDYRAHYAATAESGGIILDGVHELDYLSWMFGDIQDLLADHGRLGDLDIEAEDYVAIVLRHQDGVRSEVHLDYLRRFKRRGCEIAGTDGLLHWSSNGKAPEHCRVRLFRPGLEWTTVFEDPTLDGAAPLDSMLADFIGALGGAETDLHTGREALRILRAALSAKERGTDAREV